MNSQSSTGRNVGADSDIEAKWHRGVQTLFSLSPASVMLLAAVLCVLIALVDLAVSATYGLGLAYVVVILLVTWNAGPFAGLAFALLATVLQVFSLKGAMHDSQWFLAIALRGILFLLVLGLVHSLRRLYDGQQAVARVDWLTGAANRKHFEEVLRAEISRSARSDHPLTVAYIDCDDFKVINDTFGHATGDAMLRTVVETARSNARPSDTVARIGGDEFALLLPNTDLANAEMTVNRMNARLLEAMAKNHWPMTFSIGVATFRKNGLTPADILGSADALMYRAKQAGKGRVYCEIYADDSVQSGAPVASMAATASA